MITVHRPRTAVITTTPVTVARRRPVVRRPDGGFGRPDRPGRARSGGPARGSPGPRWSPRTRPGAALRSGGAGPVRRRTRTPDGRRRRRRGRDRADRRARDPRPATYAPAGRPPQAG